MNTLYNWIAIVAVFLFSACGYQLVNSSDIATSIGINPIKGDHDGIFLQSIINELAKSSFFSYEAFSPHLEVKVLISQLDTKNIDFQYQTDDHTGEIIDRLSPVEGSHDLIVNMTVTDVRTNKKILGPVEFRQLVDFDFSDFRSYNDLSFVDPQGLNQTTLAYSLGQLAAEDDAKLSAKSALYKKISKKMVAFLNAYLGKI